jgi:hypothetical protein
MNEDNSSSSGIIKKFRNDDRTSIHEHDFMSIRAKKEEEEQKINYLFNMWFALL